MRIVTNELIATKLERVKAHQTTPANCRCMVQRTYSNSQCPRSYSSMDNDDPFSIYIDYIYDSDAPMVVCRFGNESTWHALPVWMDVHPSFEGRPPVEWNQDR